MKVVLLLLNEWIKVWLPFATKLLKLQYYNTHSILVQSYPTQIKMRNSWIFWGELNKVNILHISKNMETNITISMIVCLSLSMSLFQYFIMIFWSWKGLFFVFTKIDSEIKWLIFHRRSRRHNIALELLPSGFLSQNCTPSVAIKKNDGMNEACKSTFSCISPFSTFCKPMLFIKI